MLKLPYNRAARVKFPGSTRNRDHGNLRVPPQCHRLRKKSLLRGYIILYVSWGWVALSGLSLNSHDKMILFSLYFFYVLKCFLFGEQKLHPRKPNMTMEQPTIWRCISSYRKWWIFFQRSPCWYLIGPSTEVPFPSMDLHPAVVGWFFPQQWAPTWKHGRKIIPSFSILRTPRVL